LNLFINNGVGQIREFVEQTLRKENETQAVLEQAVSLLVDVKLRTTFEVCLNKFLQSLDIVLPNSAATPYRVPVKRFGYIFAKAKERYKDESLDISRAGEKVRKIIDEHLISLGINPKIPPVELLSPSFIHEVQKNTSSKAKASEMEHAIRKHCKVEFNKDPTLYTKLSEKLEALIKKYKDNWDELYKQLFDLRKEVEVGRDKLPDGVSPKAAPFYDRIGQLAFGNDGVPPKYDHIVKDLVEGIVEKLQNTIDIINFWSNAPEISRLRGALSDLILLSKVPELIDRCESLVNEITDLAKARHRDIVK
jgi:type I restriction enzyme R subunit